MFSWSFYPIFFIEWMVDRVAIRHNTHFNSYGAYEIARCVIEGIRKNQLDIVKFFVDCPAFDPNKPDAVEKFDLAQTPGSEVTRPDGN